MSAMHGMPKMTRPVESGPRSKSRRLAIGLPVALALTISAGCAGGSGGDGDSSGGSASVGSGEAAAGSGEVTVALTDDVVNWNPMHAEGNNLPTETVMRNVLPAAFIPQPNGDVTLNSDLLDDATVTDVTDTSQVVTYQIAEGAVWSDGTPITAEDFRYTWQAHNRRDCAECAINASEGFDLVESVEAGEDEKTVVVTFSSPFVNWPGLFWYVFPSHLAEAHGSLAESYNGFLTEQPDWSGGPWQVADHQTGLEIVLEPNPRWYGDGPNLEQLTYRVVTDEDQQLVALRNGEIDSYTALGTNESIQRVRQLESEGVASDVNPGNRWAYLVLNTRGGPLADEEVRKAIFKNTDVDGLLERLVGNVGTEFPRLDSLVYLAPQPGYQPNALQLNIGTADIEGAKADLSAAGYTLVDGALHAPDGEQVPKLTIVTYRLPIFEQMAQLVLNDLSRLGMQADIVTHATPNTEYFVTGNFDLGIGPIAARAQAETKANETFNSEINGNYDYAGYSNPEVDRLLTDAVQASDAETAQEAMNQADMLMLEDYFMMPLLQMPRVVAYRDDILNMHDNPILTIGSSYHTQAWGYAE